MFREMRRRAQQLPEQESMAILEKAKSGVLAVVGDEGYPYAVPLSFVCCDSTIYFHCANSGHKLDAIKANPKISFCVIDKDEIIAEKFTTHYRSIIVFGKAKVVENDDEKMTVIKALSEKYSPRIDSSAEISGGWEGFSIVAIAIEHITGKAAKELMK